MNALKKLVSVGVTVLAINFLGMAVAAVLLAQRAGVDRAKLAQVRDVLFPPAADEAPAEAAPTTEPAEPTPMQQLVSLLDAQSGKPTEQRVADVRESFDARQAALGRAGREVGDREQQVRAATQDLMQQRRAFEASRDAWAAQVAAAGERAKDDGFRDSLALYQQMPPKQAKAVFLNLEDETALQYLRAMDARAAGKILKEFKSPEETLRVKALLERMRAGDAALAAAQEQAKPAAK